MRGEGLPPGFNHAGFDKLNHRVFTTPPSSGGVSVKTVFAKQKLEAQVEKTYDKDSAETCAPATPPFQ